MAEPFVRQATVDDVEAIVALNQRVYEDPRERELAWSARHVESHLHVFPEGQMVVIDDEQIVATASALVVSSGRDAYRRHTWRGVTDDGTFLSHDAFGDTLYCADLVVSPEHRRKGHARRLYAARKRLCERRNLRRMLVGARLNYAAHASEMTVEEYASRVEAKEQPDQLLSLQFSEGFTLRGVLENYAPDPHGDDYAALLEWLNPSFKSRTRKDLAARVSCVQYRMRKINNFAGFARQVRYFVDVAAGYDSDFVVFPELLTAQLMSFIRVKTPIEAISRLTEYTERVDELFKGLATEYQTSVLNGTHPTRIDDRIENVASLYMPEGQIFRQPKLHITPNERRNWGIDGGSTLQVFDTPKCRVGILVCYDVEFPEAARYLVDQGAQLILVPFCTDDRQAYLRVRYCAQARAVENQVYMALAGTVGNLPDTENMDIQYAQSAVFSPSDFAFARDGILAEASPNTETVITTDVDFEALEEAINMGSVRPRRDRRPDLFRYQMLKR